MSPFTFDSAILQKVISGESGIWKEMHGSIEFIRIYDREPFAKKEDTTYRFKIEIITDESIVQNVSGKKYLGVFSVEATWDFMKLVSVKVEKIKVETN